MKSLIGLVVLGSLVSSSLAFAAEAPATAETIKMIAARLPGGKHVGTNSRGNPCEVNVVDNDGDGSGFSATVRPVSGQLGVADFAMTPGDPLFIYTSSNQSTAYAVYGSNYRQGMSLQYKDGGQLLVTVTSTVSGVTGSGDCKITASSRQ